MKRKTNIFYDTSIDSNFLTFDNYTEALTGDILVINQKLFPSHFLCCYIKDLDIEEIDENEYITNKKEFIHKYISAYYENKLAVLRDGIDSNNDPTSSNHIDDLDTSNTALQPLGYLIITLYYYAYQKYKETNNVEDIKSIKDFEDMILNNYNIQDLKDIDSIIKDKFPGIEEYINFPFFSDIIEYDYTGTYTDIICTISPSNREYPIFNINTELIDDEKYTSIENKDITIDDENNIKSGLYGWKSQLESISEDNPIILEHINQEQIVDFVDNEKYYNRIQNITKSISTNKIDEMNNKIKFNIIIPLYTSINMDMYDEDVEQTDELELDDCNCVPIGMYFSEKPIILEGSSSNYSSNWSLLISTQFKPFPYSLNIINDETTPNAIKDAYITFAEILSKQTNYVDLLNKYNELMINLQNKISKLESIINNMGTQQNIEELYAKVMDIEKTTIKNYNTLNDRINELNDMLQHSRITWQINNQ